MDMKIKQRVKIYWGVGVGVVCFMGCACFFEAKPNREAESLSAGGGDAPARDPFGRIVIPHGTEIASVANKENEAIEDGGKPENGTAPPERLGAAGALKENAAVKDLADNEDATSDEIASNEEATPDEIAELKEDHIQERFGVILRDGKWIPTTGGGTNLVYITTGSLPPGWVGEIYDVQFQATSGFPPYTWNIVGGELPRSFSFDIHSGRLSGMPIESATVDLFLEVTDSRSAKDVAEYVLAFQPEQRLGIATETLPAAAPGKDYIFQLQATGGVPPYAWSVAGTLDESAALFLNPQTGQLYGQIAVSSTEVDIPLVFGLSDAQLHVSKELVLHVRAALSILDIPKWTVRASDPVEIYCQATGREEPYAWGVYGELPAGLEFSAEGLCSGEPSEPGLYDITVWVQDLAGHWDTAQFAMEVLPRPAVSISNFEALLSRTRVALSWEVTEMSEAFSVRIVRSSQGNPSTPSDGVTVYYGSETSYLDGDPGEGKHYYAAFLESSGTMVTSAPTPWMVVKLPPDTDPFADAVVSKHLLHPNAFRATELPQIVLGAPRGKGLVWGSTDVVSLGAATDDDGGASAPYGGAITLEFVDNEVWDGPGADFTVFENVFYICDGAGVPDPETRFMEPAVVSVSQDGVNWRQFKIDFSPRYDPVSGALNLRHPYCYHSGFAGVNPVMSAGYTPDPTDPAVSGGDSFDISEVGLGWIRYVRIQSTGNRWVIDNDGDLVYHNEENEAATRSSATSGFDLDAVTAIWMKKVESQ